jgi:hypothetical protein
MITSQYLEQVVDFDKPLLVVGPGADFSSITPFSDYRVPMDRAVLWFAEKLAGRKGRLDIFDLPTNSGNGGLHNIDGVCSYLTALKKIVTLGEINYLKGNIIDYPLTTCEYGFIWDHGTLESWSPYSNDVYLLNRLEIVQQIINNYKNALTPEGVAAITTTPNYYLPTTNMSSAIVSQSNRRIDLTEDKYATNLTVEQLSLGNKRVKSLSFLIDSHLIPTYACEAILEIRK